MLRAQEEHTVKSTYCADARAMCARVFDAAAFTAVKRGSGGTAAEHAGSMAGQAGGGKGSGGGGGDSGRAGTDS